MRGAQSLKPISEDMLSQAGDKSASKASLARNTVFAAGFFLVLFIATFLTYSPVLFDFFVGDDYVHLTWLKDAIRYPELIWRNFHSSWLDGTTTKFYRPLISIFMVTDYLMYGINGLGFHVTNLLFHAISSCFIYLIVCQIQQTFQEKSARTGAWPCAAAMLFALYPLHPEAVSWITGRVDTIVTTFCVASIWAFMRYRANGSRVLLAVSLITFVLGLLSKEMALTVPPVLVIYEWCRKRTLLAPISTWPYWAVLVGYFAVRRIALGTFVGGYDDSLLFIADLKGFVLSWLHALRMTIVPLNKELIGSHHLLTRIWEIYLVIAALAGAGIAAKHKSLRLPLLFCAAWFGLSLLPVYKIFAIGDDLQGSRLAYLATVPLCVLFTYGISNMKVPLLRNLLAAGLCVISAIGLWLNNMPWREAGLESNAIRSGLAQIYKERNGDPQVLIIGLPDHIKGAYVSRNALWGMTKQPQLFRDVKNILMVNAFEPVQPFGFLKSSLAANRDSVFVYAWNQNKQKFESIQLPQSNSELETIDWIKTDLSSELHAGPGTTYDTTVEGIVLSGQSGQRPAVIFTPPTSNWDTDFVLVKGNLKSPGNNSIGADLVYANDIRPNFALANRTHSVTPATPGSTELLFTLHSLPEWALGPTKGSQLKLLLPPNAEMEIRTISFVPAQQMMPLIEFPNSGYMGTKGYLRIDNDRQKNLLTVDATKVAGAATTEIEITRANLLFEEQNCKAKSKVAGKTIKAAIKGTVTLEPSDFKNPGIYELRAWATDKNGATVGVASDHIVLVKEQ